MLAPYGRQSLASPSVSHIFCGTICAPIVHKTAPRLQSPAFASHLRRVSDPLESPHIRLPLYKADRVTSISSRQVPSGSVSHQWCPLFIVKEGARLSGTSSDTADPTRAHFNTGAYTNRRRADTDQPLSDIHILIPVLSHLFFLPPLWTFLV